MNTEELLNECKAAFSKRNYPGDENIVHCSYDKTYGGQNDGPCYECSEVLEAFSGKPNTGNSKNWMWGYEFGLASLSPQAFTYFLPAAIELVLLGLDKAGMISETLEFRFESLDSPEWQDSRLGLLSEDELQCVKHYFEYTNEQGEFYKNEDVYHSILATISKYQSDAS